MEELMQHVPAVQPVAFADSPRIGKFHVPHETLNDGSERPMLQALFGLCIVLEAGEHESGRGKTYIAASELFEALNEGDEVPEYRIEFAYDRPFEAADHEARRTNQGRFGFVAIRKIVVRVPPVQVSVRPQVVH
jgi:hypothetical protein